MSIAHDNFKHSIRDATDLLEHFVRVNVQPPPENAEVLKRASLVMALAALETYIEDRITEAAAVTSQGAKESLLGRFFLDSLANDLRYFHSPNTKRVKDLFKKYLYLDVTEGWTWNNYDPARAKSDLDMLVSKRGEIAHRSPPPKGPIPSRHIVTREAMRKHVQFIRDLVQATDTYLEENL
ncbi:MAG: HEPN domain-containing protein [Syntrophorhabdus sp.]